MFRLVIAKFDDWFVPEWRRCWKLFSVQFNVGTALVLEAVQLTPILPTEVRALLPEPYGHIAVGVWTLIGLVGRLKSQEASASV